MSKFVDRPRYTCSLGGALATLRAIPRAIPIIHASAGCGSNLANALNAGSGYSGGGYCGGLTLPSSNVVERDVVFGGEERLSEQIEKTLEVMDGDLYIVVTGCMVEMIGDDVNNVVSEFNRKRVAQQQALPEEQSLDKVVLAVSTPSFRGNSYLGYDLIIQALAKSYVDLKHTKKNNKVNILGIPPVQDPFWKGNLKEIKRVLELIGIEVNTFFGEKEDLKSIKDSGDAALTVVLSDLVGVEAAKTFEEIHNIPYITTALPIGSIATENFLRVVGEVIGIDKGFIEKVIEDENDVYYDYVERISEIYNDADLQRYAVVVGDSNYAPALTRFLSDELGFLPQLTVITDFVTEEQKELINKSFENLESGLEANVRYDTDTSAVKRYLAEVWKRNSNERYYDSLSPIVIFGSSFERSLSEEFKIPLVTVSYPATGRIILNEGYTGFNGGLNLFSDALNGLVATR